MAAEVRAALATQLLATAAFTEPNHSENNASNLRPPVERDSSVSCRNQRRCKRAMCPLQGTRPGHSNELCL